MRPVLIAVLATAGMAIGPVLRAIIVRLSVPPGQPWRRSCAACDHPLPPARVVHQAGTPAGLAPGTAAGPVPVIPAGFAPGTSAGPVPGTPAISVTAPASRSAAGPASAPRPRIPLSALPALPPHGRCPACRARLGPRALTVEITAAAVLGLLAARIHPALVLTALCWLALCAIPLAWIDAAARRLPDLLTAPALAGTAVFLLAAAAAGGQWPRLGRGLLGGAGYAAFCLILFLISPSGMGPGDVKLAASLGTALAWLGWGTLIAGALAGFALAAVYGLALLVRGRADRKTQLPFGPFMIAGTFLALLIAGLPG
jgi:leader peptidase (prepilin peptidase)/N-methyltransferase